MSKLPAPSTGDTERLLWLAVRQGLLLAIADMEKESAMRRGFLLIVRAIERHYGLNTA